MPQIHTSLVMGLSTALTVTAAGLFAGAAPQHAQEGLDRAVAVLVPTKGSKVEGTVSFVKEGNGVRVQGKVTGLTPGKHGFHIHEFGDQRSADGKSAGSHFNPTKEKHGGPAGTMRHVGDLGNIEANAEGVATIDVVDPMLAFTGEKSVLGRGLVVHEKADDLTTQPTGDAGGRLAVGVIGVAQPPTPEK
jgi:Cu-Zn family superoxide dismutase